MVAHNEPGARITRHRVPIWLLLLLTLGLAIFGLVVLTSAGKSFINKGGDPLFIFKRQAFWFFPALVAGLCTAFIDLDKIRAHVWKFYFVTCGLLLAARIPGIGRDVKGSWRWLEFGPVKLQVSDIGKVALVIALSHYLASNRRWFSPPRPKLVEWDWSAWREWRPAGGDFVRLLFFPLWPMRFLRPTGFALREKRVAGAGIPYPVSVDDAAGDFLNGFVKPCLVVGGICGLIAIEPDLGTTVLCAAVGGVLLFVAGVRHLFVWPLVATGAAGFTVLVMNWENRLRRVLAFLNPEGLKDDASFQLWQGMIGFGVGGVDGAGLGRGMQQQAYLPEAHTDFVFAIVGEELGLRFTLGVVAAFLCIFLVVITNLRRQQDVYRFNICLGATLFIVLQALINMGVVTGCLPTKGMSLPFISYGGTNLVMMFALVGLIINCMRTGSRILPGGPSELS